MSVTTAELCGSCTKLPATYKFTAVCTFTEAHLVHYICRIEQRSLCQARAVLLLITLCMLLFGHTVCNTLCGVGLVGDAILNVKRVVYTYLATDVSEPLKVAETYQRCRLNGQSKCLLFCFVPNIYKLPFSALLFSTACRIPLNLFKYSIP
jgi:hypothetical protein